MIAWLRHRSGTTRLFCALSAIAFIYIVSHSTHRVTYDDVFSSFDRDRNEQVGTSHDDSESSYGEENATVETHNVNETEWAPVYQSWMEYPEAIFFPRGPPLLDAANPKSLKVLLVNIHHGVENELHSVLAQAVAPLDVNVRFTQTQGVMDLAGLDVTEEASKTYYPSHTEQCDTNRYDLMIVGDVIPFGRPYLQADCKTNIILYITNRFDFGIRGDPEYAALIQSASRWPNVRVLVNNLYEQYYARILRDANIHVYAHAPATGSLSRTAQHWLVQSEVNWSTVGEDELILVHKPDQPYLLTLLQEQNIPLPLMVADHYGGPLALAGRFLVHIPYQVNTMSLFENLNTGVLYILPSLQLYHDWIENHWFHLDYNERKWTEDELRTYVDWYRHDLSHLFFYFDDLNDLAPGSAFRKRIANEAEAKKKAIREYMVYHVNRTVEGWRQTLCSFPRLSKAQAVRRKFGLGTELPVAELGPPTMDINTT